MFISLVVIASLFFSAKISAGDFELVRGNQAQSTIVLLADAPKKVAEAVGHFNRTLKTITGTSLPVAQKETAGNRIVLAIRKMDSLMTADHYAITFPDSRTMKIEGTEYSVQWAFNHIIRKYAKAEWVLPESCGLSYTPMKDLVVPAEKIEVKDISCPVSRINSGQPIWHMYDLRLGLGCNHNLTRYAFPKEKYGKDKWPQVIMPVLNGKKISAPPKPNKPTHYWQPCYSNPETAKIAVANLLEYLEKHPGTTGLSLAVNDNCGFCECNQCMKLDKNNKNNRSESYFTFVNRVMGEVSKKYPNLIVATLAYDRTYLTPSFKLHPNVVVFLTVDFGSCVSPKVKERHKKIIAGWSKKSSMFGVWDYSWGYPYPIPRMYLPVHLEMLKYLFEHNAKAYCGQSWLVDAREGPKQFLISKFLWNSKLDMQKLEKEWYVRCVGEKAAPYLKAYYQVWNDYFTGNRVKQTPWFKSATSVYMTYNDISCIYALREEDIQAADKAMKQVVELAETKQEKQRAEVLLRLWRHSFLRLRLLGTGIYDQSGRIQTADQACNLLEIILKSPEYLKEYEQISSQLIKEKALRYQYLSKEWIREGASPVGLKFDQYLNGHILAAAVFRTQSSDVKKLMQKICIDHRLPVSVRTLSLLLSEPERHKNFLPDGTAENGVTKQFCIRTSYSSNGSLSVTDQFAASGKKSFQVHVRSHDVAFQIAASGLKKGKKYIFSFKSFIPAPSGEGYLQVWCIGSQDSQYNRSHGLTPFKLSGSVWQSFTVLSPVLISDKLFIRIYLRNYEIGEKVFFDDLRLMEIEDPGQEKTKISDNTVQKNFRIEKTANLKR